MRKANYLPNRFIQEENLSSVEITPYIIILKTDSETHGMLDLNCKYLSTQWLFIWISIFTRGAQNFASLLGLKLLALNNSFWSEKSSSYKSQMLITLDWLSCNAARSWKFNIRYETILEWGYNRQRQVNWVKL